jgi:hypothetical protein
MIVVAENCDHSQPRGQARQWCLQTSGSLGCTNGVVSNDEVSGQQHQIRPCRVHLADDPAQPLRVHRPVAKVNVGQQRDRERRRVSRPSSEPQCQPALNRIGFCFLQAYHHEQSSKQKQRNAYAFQPPQSPTRLFSISAY